MVVIIIMYIIKMNIVLPDSFLSTSIQALVLSLVLPSLYKILL
jgi:hypothetical protein